MQIQVKDTRMEKVTFTTSRISKYKGEISKTYDMEVPVAEAKLILVECKPEEALLFQQEANIYEGQINLYSFKYGLIKGSGKYLKPILISETEKIEHPNKSYCTYTKNINEWSGFEKQECCFKILALPEHFSPEYLLDIVDGKMKDGDKVLIECVHLYHRGNPDTESSWKENPTDGGYFIRLNFNNHITLHKIEEKVYTIQEVIEELRKGLSKYGKKKEISGLWVLEDNIYHVLNSLNKM